MPRPCNHQWYEDGCPACSRCLDPGPLGVFYRRRWGEAGSVCIHLGLPTGTTVDCPTCNGRVSLKLFSCGAYGGECTPVKKVPGVRSCADNCPRFEGSGLLYINHGAGGIGDALLGLLVVGSLKKVTPNTRIVYAVAGYARAFITLFDGGYDHLADHKHDGSFDLPYDGLRQMNNGYRYECDTNCAKPRWLRYGSNVKAPGTVMPRLRRRDYLLKIGAGFTGCVVLAPYSTDHNRNYPSASWVVLDELLRTRGYRTLIIDDRHDRLDAFPGEKLMGAPADVVTGVLLNANCVVGNDSGMAHLAGCLEVPAVVVAGRPPGANVYGAYPSVRCLQGGMPGDVTPDVVAAEVDKVVLPILCGGRAVIDGDKLVVLRDLLRETNCLTGDVAEFGVYRGGSAKLIGHFAPGAALHLFDTFSGIPCDDPFPGAHRRGDFADTSSSEVLGFLNNPRALAHVGVFPSTAPPDVRYRFVHLDADLYESTKDALKYFLPRLVPGGVLLMDDYGWERCPGVETATGEVLGQDAALEHPTLNQAVYRRKR